MEADDRFGPDLDGHAALPPDRIDEEVIRAPVGWRSGQTREAGRCDGRS